MKLPLTDLFGYVYNWQTWVNKEENWFYTISGLAVLFILIYTIIGFLSPCYLWL